MSGLNCALFYELYDQLRTTLVATAGSKSFKKGTRRYSNRIWENYNVTSSQRPDRDTHPTMTHGWLGLECVQNDSQYVRCVERIEEWCRMNIDEL